MKNTTTRPLMSNKIPSTKNGLHLFEYYWTKGPIDVIHALKIIASTISYQNNWTAIIVSKNIKNKYSSYCFICASRSVSPLVCPSVCQLCFCIHLCLSHFFCSFSIYGEIGKKALLLKTWQIFHQIWSNGTGLKWKLHS